MKKRHFTIETECECGHNTEFAYVCDNMNLGKDDNFNEKPTYCSECGAPLSDQFLDWELSDAG